MLVSSSTGVFLGAPVTCVLRLWKYQLLYDPFFMSYIQCVLVLHNSLLAKRYGPRLGKNQSLFWLKTGFIRHDDRFFFQRYFVDRGESSQKYKIQFRLLSWILFRLGHSSSITSFYTFSLLSQMRQPRSQTTAFGHFSQITRQVQALLFLDAIASLELGYESQWPLS